MKKFLLKNNTWLYTDSSFRDCVRIITALNTTDRERGVAHLMLYEFYNRFITSKGFDLVHLNKSIACGNKLAAVIISTSLNYRARALQEHLNNDLTNVEYDIIYTYLAAYYKLSDPIMYHRYVELSLRCGNNAALHDIMLNSQLYVELTPEEKYEILHRNAQIGDPSLVLLFVESALSMCGDEFSSADSYNCIIGILDKLNPTFTLYGVYLFMLYYIENNKQLAVQLFEQAIIGECCDTIYNIYGVILHEHGAYERSYELIKKAYKKNEKHYLCYILYLIERQKINKAIKLLKAVIVEYKNIEAIKYILILYENDTRKYFKYNYIGWNIDKSVFVNPVQLFNADILWCPEYNKYFDNNDIIMLLLLISKDIKKYIPRFVMFRVIRWI